MVEGRGESAPVLLLVQEQHPWYAASTEAVRGLTPEEAAAEYPHLWATIAAELPEIAPERRARIVALARGVCAYCHSAASEPADGSIGCQCWNDE